MNPTFKSAMLAAAQLTAAGNLSAATATIQRALAAEGSVTPAPLAARTGAAQDSAGDVIDVQARWRPDETTRVDGEPGQTLTGAFGNAAGKREYQLYLPKRAAPAAGAPALVVMLHGCTQSPADFAAGTAMNALADRHGFLVLYPGQSKAANQSACWNWFNPDDQRADSGEPSIIAGMARDIVARHGVDRRRIYVAGLSAGGAMAAILGNAYPELVAAVAIHSGLRPGAAHDLSSALSAMKRGAPSSGTARAGSGPGAGERAVRTIVFHGRQDRTVHPANGGQVVDAALAAWPPGALAARQETGRSPGGRSYVRTVHVDAAGKPMVERWEVQGAGHAWSGGSPRGTHTDPLGPDASAAMIDFFLAH